MPVNSTTWKRLPWAPRESEFSADDAIARISAWANGSQEKFATAFLWNSGAGAGINPNNYRLPVGDISNGRLILVPRAIFSAATIASGAHGGLETVVSKQELDEVKRVITQIYDQFRTKWNDRRQIPPWLRGGNELGQTVASLTASVNSSGWASMPIASTARVWSGDTARKALWEWAGGDLRKYRKGFLWWDNTNPDVRQSYKLPIAIPVSGTLTIVPRAVNAVAQVLGGARDGVDIPASDMDAVAAIVDQIQGRFEDDAVSAALGASPEREHLVYPDASWFTDPQFQGPTPLAVTADGRVMGHLATWNQCHMGARDKCVMAPKSAMDYRLFLDGHVLTADGSSVRVGKITMGTGHADLHLGYLPASDHYDNTGNAVAVVAAGEDRFGIWVAGSVVPEASDVQVQQLRRSPLSGDWRRFNGNLELVAALAVNSPGFPVISMTASGEVESMCAAGVLAEDGTVFHDAAGPIPAPDRRVLDMAADLEEKVNRLTRLSRKAHVKTLLDRGI